MGPPGGLTRGGAVGPRGHRQGEGARLPLLLVLVHQLLINRSMHVILGEGGRERETERDTESETEREIERVREREREAEIQRK